MTAADWLKFTPGWLAFLVTMGTLIRRTWTVRQNLALGPEASELRTQLVQFRALLEEVGTKYTGWFLHEDRREVALRAAFESVMAGIRVPRSGPGRPRTRPDAVLADRAYSSRAIRSHLRRRGIRAVIQDKLAIAYQAALHLAAILIWIRR